MLVQSIERENQLQRMRNIERVFQTHSIINDKLKAASFDTYIPTNGELAEAKRECLAFANEFKRGEAGDLLLTGTYGTGKSHLAVSICKRLNEREFTSIFISVPKLLTKFRSTYNKESNYTEGDLVNALTEVDCLVLDDMGAEKQTDWTLDKLFDVFDSRKGKHTILTTNFKLEELPERIGPRNFSRIMEDITVLEMDGEDYRLRNLK